MATLFFQAILWLSVYRHCHIFACMQTNYGLVCSPRKYLVLLALSFYVFRATALLLPVITGNYVSTAKCAFSKQFCGYNVPHINLLGSWFCLFLFLCQQHGLYVHNCSNARDFYVSPSNSLILYKAHKINVCNSLPSPVFWGVKGNNVNYSKFKAYFLHSYGSTCLRVVQGGLVCLLKCR